MLTHSHPHSYTTISLHDCIQIDGIKCSIHSIIQQPPPFYLARSYVIQKSKDFLFFGMSWFDRKSAEVRTRRKKSYHHIVEKFLRKLLHNHHLQSKAIIISSNTAIVIKSSSCNHFLRCQCSIIIKLKAWEHFSKMQTKPNFNR